MPWPICHKFDTVGWAWKQKRSFCMIFRYKAIGYIMPPKVSGLVDRKFGFGTKLNENAYLVEDLPQTCEVLCEMMFSDVLNPNYPKLVNHHQKNTGNNFFWKGHLTIPKRFFNRNFSPWCQRITSKGHWVTTSTLAIQNEGDRSRSVARSKENFDAILKVEPTKIIDAIDYDCFLVGNCILAFRLPNFWTWHISVGICFHKYRWSYKIHFFTVRISLATHRFPCTCLGPFSHLRGVK